jgi:lipoprotein-anchoring transpeptidase ErfK/SrfK
MVDEPQAQQYLASAWPWLGEQRYLDADEIVPQMIDVLTTGRTGIDARVYHQPLQHTVRPGESYSSIGYNYGIPYPWIQQANPGIDTLSVGDVVTVPSPDDMLPLPVVTDKRVVVSISQQRAWVYEDGQLKWEWPASTGISSSPTSPGIFQIQSHEQEAYASNWDLNMPHFMGIYRPVPTSDFMNGFHGFPNRDGFNLLWTGDLGTPVTYGCILLSSDSAQALYNWAEEGVVVEIQR